MSAVLRACAVCAKPSAIGYCPEHEPKPWASSKRKSRLTLSGSKEQARRKRVLARYLDTCHVCGRRGADQVDHVVPLAEGGPDDESNCAPIHAEPCHREKTAEEARRAREASKRPGDGPRSAPKRGVGGAAVRAGAETSRGDE